MKLFVADAFTARRFCGNQAGVALLDREEPFPSDAAMIRLAAELKHSETVFVRPAEGREFRCRYFTPECEVELCGHATVAAFTVLREEERLEPGRYAVSAPAGRLEVDLGRDAVWMDMAPPQRVRSFSRGEAAELYAAYGLSLKDMPGQMEPEAVSAGLCDILLPVAEREALDRAVQNEAEVTRLSERYDVVGVHMFWPELSPQVTARCRNFAPRCAIPEEAATGTSNAALAFYLHCRGKSAPGTELCFVQGERMGKPSQIFARLEDGGEGVRVRIGGRAAVTLRLELCGSPEE